MTSVCDNYQETLGMTNFAGNGVRTAVVDTPVAVNGVRAAVVDTPVAVNGGRTAVVDTPVAVNGVRAAVVDTPVAVNGVKVAIVPDTTVIDPPEVDIPEGGDIVEEWVVRRPKTVLNWVSRWMALSSCNGVSNIERGRHLVRKLFWITVVLVGSALTLKQVVDTVQLYLSRPIAVSFTMEFASSLNFPAVTVCNVNPMRKSKLALGQHKLGAILRHSSEGNESLNMFTNKGRWEIRERFVEEWVKLPEETRHKMGHQAKDFIIDCAFDGAPCDHRDFIPIFNPVYGNCFVFNSGWDKSIVRKVHKAGVMYGLVLALNLQQAEYVAELTDVVGAAIEVHHRTYMPFPEETGILVPAGYMTHVGMQLRNMTRLKHPYKSKCWDLTREDAKRQSVYSQAYPVHYSQQACSRTCYQYHMIHQCGCADPSVPRSGIALMTPEHIGPVRPCWQEDEEQCERSVKAKFHHNLLKCNCSVPCNTMEYSTYLSAAEWPNKAVEELYTRDLSEMRDIFNSTDGFGIRHNIAKLQIFFARMNYEQIVEEPAYTVTNLYSDLGGNIGFYLGLSIVGLFEFFELLIDVVRVALLQCRAKRQFEKNRKQVGSASGQQYLGPRL